MHDNVTVLHDNANRSRGLTQSCPNALMNHCYYSLMFILEWGAWGPVFSDLWIRKAENEIQTM